MKKRSLCLAAILALLFSVLNFSCSGGDDTPVLVVGPWTTEEPVVTPTDSNGGTQTTPGTTESVPQQPAEWNVTYVITNGSDDMESESRTNGKFTAQSVLIIPQKEGFQFKGWYLDQAQTQAVASFANMTGDVVLYGHWAGKLYTVAFEGIDGATLEIIGSDVVTGFSTEDKSLALPHYIKRFYNFDGWYLNSDFSGTAVTQIDRSSAAAGATLTLYAKWTPTEYNVTYVIANGSDDMTGESRTSGKYSCESALTIPKKEGFQFKGWYLDAKQKQPVVSFAGLGRDLILYGHWAGKIYDVQIVGTDGAALAQGAMPVTGFSTEDQSLALPSYTKRFYSFDGLYLDSGYNGTAVTQIDSSSAAAGSTLTLYAKWTEKVYNVNYDLVFESGVTNPNPSVVTASTGGVLETPTYTDGNFVFAGWFASYSYGKYSSQVTELNVDSVRDDNSITLYAKWTRATPWTPSGATVRVTSMQTVAGDIGWLSGDEFYLLVTDSSIAATQFRPLTNRLRDQSGRRFYLDFSAATTKFELKDNNFTFCDSLTGITLPECPAFTTIPKEAFYFCEGLTIVKLPGQITEICDHAFADCYNLKTLYLPKKLLTVGCAAFFGCGIKETYYNSSYEDLKKVKFDAVASSKPTWRGGDLYALEQGQWEKVHFITYDLNPGNWITGYTPQELFMESESILLPTTENVYRDGYDFGGWYDNKDYTGSSFASAPSGTKEDVTYWAKWTPRNDTPYKVLHYKENLEDSNYTLCETENLTGTTDSYVTPTAKDYPGFKAKTVGRHSIDANGSTEIKIYYERKTVTLTLYLAGGTLDGQTGTIKKTGKIGAAVPSVPNPQKTDTIFLGWNTNGGTLPSVFAENATYTAVWRLNEVRGIDITVEPPLPDDISVTKSQSGNTVTFTAEECDSYSWALDGAEKGSARTCSIDTSILLKGTYTLTLEAQKGGRWFSYTAQIKVN